MTTTVDAVVIGSGPNGLVAANLLVDAGWSVVVLEEQAGPGGAVKSDDSVAAGYIHDTFSSFYPLAAGSPTIQSLQLERHGLEWATSPSVLSHSLSGSRWAVLHSDRERTAEGLDRAAPGDGEAWLRLCATWDRVGEHFIRCLLTPFPPVRGGVGLGRDLVGGGGLDFVRQLLMSARALGDALFEGEQAKLLIAGNAAHADIPMNAPGSGAMGLLLVMLGQSLGFPVPRGGAGMLTAALAGRFTSAGGELALAERAERIVVRSGRAHAVRTSTREIVARHAVVADVSAPALYGGLVAWDDLPDRLRRRMHSFQWDPSTIKVDWALSGPVPWTSPPQAPSGTVHIADSLDELTEWGTQIDTGLVPATPFLIVGQMAVADPSRAPEGHESVWAYTHVPRRVRGDAGAGAKDRPLTGTWDASEIERMADRMEARLESRAPGFRDRVVARRVLGPHEMELRDANLVLGAINGGTAELHQQVIFRPVAGWGRPETPVRGLYLGSASAHPGGGVHGACGANAARAALWHQRIRMPWRRV